MGRVGYILLIEDNMVGQFSFKTKASWTSTQWMADDPAWRGISTDRIHWIPQTEGLLGTLTETRTIAGNLPKDVKRDGLCLFRKRPELIMGNEAHLYDYQRLKEWLK